MTRREARSGSPVRSRPVTEIRLRIDAAACDGIGLCAHLAPAVIELDRWGFPILIGRGLAPREVAAARQAVRGCPRNALWIESTDVPEA
jgi:ferredoxin